ncbi:hypothetical protein AVEN_122890-1 [Araneus ventricosus]|uniref:Uncharacterized protein n=1 Tax=Araneus ventricosus TaxID=182803 RepID=A0A4Y2WUS4_ARAVE|nr:hypothetical protein AVEN_27278-1 [Araneus ventricosus]GBO41074.1 hypothetical protein AVEN_34955-1 [Araneus ventricosus]GBO41199.1 hypothetical protein AVEN_59349-1 [Araneus ventricosus]GBO41205.1 hypothetical protein AVEN_122890-1 [Araneus ventricosus]
MAYGNTVFPPSDNFCSESIERVPRTLRVLMDPLSGKKRDESINAHKSALKPLPFINLPPGDANTLYTALKHADDDSLQQSSKI